ncbi:hypothetical protein [Bacillus cereus]|uniref:hypothetical protein n=1 Tax=Bacillus cereus TaxID=1396 RepID=UPI000952C883|nr:hypothetical protein [Bacillus cereus]OLR25804.1 hypothetical protein BLD50_10145 [Bacillus cereus]
MTKNRGMDRGANRAEMLAQWEEVVGKRITYEAVGTMENVGVATGGRCRSMPEWGSAYLRV